MGSVYDKWLTKIFVRNESLVRGGGGKALTCFLCKVQRRHHYQWVWGNEGEMTGGGDLHIHQVASMARVRLTRSQTAGPGGQPSVQ